METIFAWSHEADGTFGFVVNDEELGQRLSFGPENTAGSGSMEFTGIGEISSITFTTIDSSGGSSRATAGFRATILITQDLVVQNLVCIDCPADSNLLTLDKADF